jgi:YHS domain-containing protein
MEITMNLKQTLKSLMAALVLGTSLLAVAPVTAFAKQPAIYTANQEKLGLDGYDPVAYFTAGKPAVGSPTFKAEHNGAIWRFTSEANRTAFLANPAKYVPQFGGYCSWAVSQGYTAPGDPLTGRVVEGKLYVNYNADVAKTWAKDIPGNIKKGNANWPVVLDK